MITPEHIVAVANALSEATGLPRTTVSRRIFGSSSRLQRLADGGDLGTRTATDAMRRLADDWPAGVAWPAGVPHPFLPGGFAPSPPQPAAGVASPDAAGGLSVSDEVAE